MLFINPCFHQQAPNIIRLSRSEETHEMPGFKEQKLGDKKQLLHKRKSSAKTIDPLFWIVLWSKSYSYKKFQWNPVNDYTMWHSFLSFQEPISLFMLNLTLNSSQLRPDSASAYQKYIHSTIVIFLLRMYLLVEAHTFNDGRPFISKHILIYTHLKSIRFEYKVEI